MIRDYRDLKVWALAMDLAEAVYALTRNFPATERFSLTMQIRRAAVSVPSNIAEGAVRDSTPEFARFLAIAAGSLAELRTQLLLADRLGFTASHDLHPRIDETARLLGGLRAALKRKLST